MTSTGTTYDVIVIGLGAMGSAACCHLARRGRSVLGLEQFSIPHDLGSSHGESRMIRLCYFEHPDYVPLLHRTYELWRQLEHDTGRSLLEITGGLYIGAADGEIVTGTLESARTHDLPHEAIDRAEVERRFPMFRLAPEHVGVWEPQAGFLRPELVIATHTELALKHGAELRCLEPMRSFAADDDGVTVTTDAGTYRGRHLVIAAGAWCANVLGDVGLDLQATRQVLGWVWPRNDEPFRHGRFPVWAIDHPDGSLHYGFPMVPERPGLKLGHHIAGTPGDADTIDRTATLDEASQFRHILTEHIPDADGPLLALRVCLYTYTPDAHFIVDRHPRHENVTIAAGFSGHGFKFAAVMGEVLADLATDGSTKWPIGFLGLDRFASA